MWRRCVSYPAKARRPEKQKWILYAAKAYGSIWEGKPKPGGLPSDLIGGANPPDERKEGVVLCQDLAQVKMRNLSSS